MGCIEPRDQKYILGKNEVGAETFTKISLFLMTKISK